MKVDLQYDDEVFAGFLLGGLPAGLMDVIADQKERLLSTANNAHGWREQDVLPFEGRKYQILFASGRVRKMNRASVQELMILDVRKL